MISARLSLRFVNVYSGQANKDLDPVYGRMFQVSFEDQICNEIGISIIIARGILSVDQVNTQ